MNTSTLVLSPGQDETAESFAARLVGTFGPAWLGQATPAKSVEIQMPSGYREEALTGWLVQCLRDLTEWTASKRIFLRILEGGRDVTVSFGFTSRIPGRTVNRMVWKHFQDWLRQETQAQPGIDQKLQLGRLLNLSVDEIDRVLVSGNIDPADAVEAYRRATTMLASKVFQEEFAVVGAAMVGGVWFRAVIQPHRKEALLYAVMPGSFDLTHMHDGGHRQRLQKVSDWATAAAVPIDEEWVLYEVNDSLNPVFSRYVRRDNDWVGAEIPFDELDADHFFRLIVLAGDCGTPFQPRRTRT